MTSTRKQAKSTDTPQKQKSEKLGRRLSAKFGAFLHSSPKKSPVEEKKQPVVAASSESEGAPKVDTPIDDSKLAAAEPALEEAVAKDAAAEPVVGASAVEETPKVEEAPATIEVRSFPHLPRRARADLLPLSNETAYRDRGSRRR